MDVSVLAAVGSFVVSERVLKPKATVLVILGCVLAYDLTTKTRDPSSLRVYRGPSLLAFTLMMVAYSLRTWRRNGVACDELLFLPGTPHGEYHGVEGPPSLSRPSSSAVDDDEHEQSPRSNRVSVARSGSALCSSGTKRGRRKKSDRKNEGDVAAGGVGGLLAAAAGKLSLSPSSQTSPAGSSNSNPKRGGSLRNRTISRESSVSSFQELANSWDNDKAADGDGLDVTNDADNQGGVLDVDALQIDEDEHDHDDDDNDETRPLTASIDEESDTTDRRKPGIGCGAGLARRRPLQSSSADDATAGAGGAVERFQQQHPRITRIGSFFFFRSASSSTENATYAPSGPSVFGAALDLSMPVLFNFHLFIEAFNHMGDTIASKTLPLIFLSVLIIRAFFPPGRRARFWNTLKYTFMAPFHRSLFRDSYIGDVLTSLVRPTQDIMFALSYYCTVVYGTVMGKYGLRASGEILHNSWILHNVFLPSCALLPLWFRFLQTLRESYDTGKRWPHLGNAFKYLSAALVIMYGMTHPENRRSPLWLISFGLALAYQIWWDTFIDWELFVFAPRNEDSPDFESWWFWRISSVHPNSRVLLALQRRFFQPIRDCIAAIIRRLRLLKQIQLRPRRLYKSDSFYWKIFVYNLLMRFTWMLCFIPAYHLSSKNQKVTTFSSDTITYVGVLLPIAEILRRTFWGFLYLEVRTIKMLDGDPQYSALQMNESEEMTLDFSNSSFNSTDSSKPAPRSYLPSWLRKAQQQHNSQEDSGGSSGSGSRCCKQPEFDPETQHQLYVAELSVWALAFVGLGLWVTD